MPPTLRIPDALLRAALTALACLAPCAVLAQPPDAGANPPAAPARPKRPRLPPPPPGVTHLEWADFFEPNPEREFKLTPKIQALKGRKVRLLGFMVDHDMPQPGTFLLAPLPLKLHQKEYGLADDLPAQAVYVLVPGAGKADRSPRVLPHVSGMMLLTGDLDIGNREEPDGRVTFFRLRLDPPKPTPNTGKKPPKRAAPPARKQGSRPGPR